MTSRDKDIGETDKPLSTENEPDMRPLVSLQNVGKGYASPVKIGRIAMRRLAGMKPEIWHQALKNVTFDIKPGENVGVLGRNGAGKSTLLSMVAGAMRPDEGTLHTNGRIAAVLSLGRGLDPQLPGRENAILFARTLGATKAEVTARIDDILEFSELGDAFEDPMRTYSSGMRARLAFSTAFHVDADLMILDETLAVGDLSFRFKCYEALAARQKSANTSLLIVSHNPMTLSRFCERIIVIDGGRVVFDGPSDEGLITYKEVRVRRDEGLSDPAQPDIVVVEPRTRSSIIFRETDAEWSFPMRLTCLKDCCELSLRAGLADSSGVTLGATTIDLPSPSPQGWAAGDVADFDLVMDKMLRASKGRLAATLELTEDGQTRPIFHLAKLMRWRVAGKPVEGELIELGYEPTRGVNPSMSGTNVRAEERS